MEIGVFWFEYQTNIFPKAKLEIVQHWFWLWVGTEQATSHYLTQWWHNSQTRITQPQAAKMCKIACWIIQGSTENHFIIYYGKGFHHDFIFILGWESCCSTLAKISWLTNYISARTWGSTSYRSRRESAAITDRGSGDTAHSHGDVRQGSNQGPWQGRARR